ncbi:hypothetical protein JCM11251_004004 [Rhodosporidiobolus azoricus]
MRIPLILFALSSLSLVNAAGTFSPLSHGLLSKRQGTALRCTNGFTLSSDKLSCICRPPKVTNVDKSKCLTACTSGSFAVGDGTCAACPPTFAKCSSAEVATGCVAGYSLLGKTCVQTCPSGQWGDASPGKNRCRPCVDKDAVSCLASDSGKTSTACLTKYLYKGACLDAANVPDGFFADAATHTIKPCRAGVRTCISEAVDGATACAKDSVGTPLFLTPTRNCILAAAGVAGYYADQASRTFKQCDDGVTSCTGSGAGTALTCGKRSDSTPLFWRPVASIERLVTTRDRLSRRQAASLLEGDCVEADDCPQATWADPIASLCTACDDNELECTKNGQGGSLVCKRDFYLSTSNNCLTAEECKASGAFYPDSDSNVCSSCDPGELACSDNGIGFAEACGTNENGDQLYLHEGDCVIAPDCPAAYFPNNATSSRTQITSLRLADLLNLSGNRLFLQNGTCVEQCEEDAWANPTCGRCELCTTLDPDAETCDSPTSFTCATKFFLPSASRCVDACPGAHFTDMVGQVCSPCVGEDVATCSSAVPGSATSCSMGNLHQGMCMGACPSGFFAFSFDRLCRSCAYFSLSTATCTDAGPLTCYDGNVIGYDPERWSEACISQNSCNDGYNVAQDGRCVSCQALYTFTIMCNAQGPLSCFYTHNLYRGQCVEKCRSAGYGYFPEPNPSPPNVFSRAQYRKEDGTCGRDCLDVNAISCDATTGKTISCIKSPAWCTNW